jgi:hypothetical protein
MKSMPHASVSGLLLSITLGMVLCGCRETASIPVGQGTQPAATEVPKPAEARRWTFVVLGDTRDLSDETQTGISPALNRLAKTIAAEKPDLVIHNGDLINGFYTSRGSEIHGKFREMFDNWKQAMRPIYDFEHRTGIPFYVVRGNHEDGLLVTDDELKASYLENIASFMPQNGPAKEKGLTYSVTFSQCKLIALDEYSIKELGELRGLVDQPWLNGELAKDHSVFTFVFGHAPAFKVSTFHKGPYPDLYDFPKHRDRFWSSLKQANVPIYFCGHVHFYCRVVKDGVSQVLVGNGGANHVAFDPHEVDPSVTLDYPTGPVPDSEIKDGYLLVTVDEKAHTVNAVQKVWNEQTQAWEIGDTFTIQ